MTARENLLRAARFEKPEYIPMSFSVGAGCWNRYPQEALQELMADHPLLFPNFRRSSEPIRPAYAPWRRAGKPYTDSWNCVWETTEDGITGAVTTHALGDWEQFDTFIPPDPDHHDGWGRINWKQKRKAIAAVKKQGQLLQGSLRHGYTFLTLTYLRSYKHLLFDMMDEEPRLTSLLQMVEDFNMGLVERYLDLDVEWMAYPEDLGMQAGPMIPPQQFRKYIKPSYQRLIAPARERGCVIHMHSDGDIRTLVDDLLDVGVDVLNLQDLVNGIDWIKEHLVNRVCVDLDIDRQKITRFGTPQQIDELIREAVQKLGSKEGGLMMRYGLFPGIPLENIKALMDAMGKYATYYA